MLLYLQQMLQLLLAPSKGWEDVAAGPMSAHGALRRGLLPLAAVAGLTVLCRGLYLFQPQWSRLAAEAVIVFLQYFLTYFLALLIMLAFLPRLTASDAPADEHRVSLFVSMATGMMAVIAILGNLLPRGVTLLEFLPLLVVVVMYRGREFLGVRADVQGRFVCLGIVSVILPVYLIEWLFSKLFT